MNNILSESQIITPQLQAIKPYSYPIFVKISVIIFLIFFLFFIKDLPYCFSINKKMKYAYSALQKGDYFDAYVKYTELSSIFPNNKKLKIRIIQALFASPQKENHIMALNHLQSITLNKTEWKNLQQYIPQQYASMFEFKSIFTPEYRTVKL